MTTSQADPITQALAWFDANRDGTAAQFRRRFRRAADQLLTACQSHGYVAPAGRHFELTIPGLRRLHEIRARE